MTSWIADGESGLSVRTKLNTGPTRTIQLTSGASPTNVTLPSDDAWTNLVVEVTSGGTAGTEIINIPNFPPVQDGYADDARFGRRAVVFMGTQTDPADVVNVTINGGDTIIVLDNTLNTLLATTSAVVLDFVGASAPFIWVGYRWSWDRGDDDNDLVSLVAYMPPVPVNTLNGVPLVNLGGTATWFADQGMVKSYEQPTLSGSNHVINVDVWASRLVTSGGGINHPISIPNLGSPNPSYAGSYHVITLLTLADPGDTVTLNVSNVEFVDGSAVSSAVLDAADEYILLQAYDTDGWRVLSASTGVCTPEVAAPANQTSASGSFTTTDLKTVTVVNGIITSIA